MSLMCSAPLPVNLYCTTYGEDSQDKLVPHQSSTSHLRSQICRNGKKLRTLTFQRQWFDQFPWLLIRHDVDGVLCRPCVEANLRRLMTDSVG